MIASHKYSFSVVVSYQTLRRNNTEEVVSIINDVAEIAIEI